MPTIIDKEQIDRMLEIAKTSPALKWKSDKKGSFAYPANFRGRVPLKVRMATNAKSDIPVIPGDDKDISVNKDNAYYVWVNSFGAVSAILPDGERLGLYPSEFDVIEWHEEEDNATNSK